MCVWLRCSLETLTVLLLKHTHVTLATNELWHSERKAKDSTMNLSCRHAKDTKFHSRCSRYLFHPVMACLSLSHGSLLL